LLPLSSPAIEFGHSRDYLKLTYALHLFAIAVLWNSSLSFAILCLMMSIVLVSITYIVRHPSPVQTYNKLVYKGHQWLLFDITDVVHRYDEAQVQLDAGIFFLLRLSNAQTYKILVIFHDQISQSQYAMINILGKIRPSKKVLKS